MLKYGTDKPDLRNPIEIRGFSEIFRAAPKSSSRPSRNKTVRAIPAPAPRPSRAASSTS